MIKAFQWKPMPLGSLPNVAPLFIVGAGRSGTTPLQLALNMHPQLGVYGETQAFFARKRFGTIADDFEFRRLVNYWHDIVSEQTPHKDLLDSGCVHNRLSQARTYAEVVDIVMGGLATRDRKARWGEKTPAHVFCLSDIASSFPNAQVIHMVRDPRGVVCSNIHAFGDGQFIDRAIYGATRYWLRCFQIHAEQQQKADGRHILIRYEDFVTFPEATLRKICGFLKVDFVEEMLSFYQTAKNYVRKDKAGNLPPRHTLTQKPPDASRTHAWKNILSPRQVGMIECLASGEMRALGYETVSTRECYPSKLCTAYLSALWNTTESRRVATREAKVHYWSIQRVTAAREERLWRFFRRQRAA